MPLPLATSFLRRDLCCRLEPSTVAHSLEALPPKYVGDVKNLLGAIAFSLEDLAADAEVAAVIDFLGLLRDTPEEDEPR